MTGRRCVRDAPRDGFAEKNFCLMSYVVDGVSVRSLRAICLLRYAGTAKRIVVSAMSRAGVTTFVVFAVSSLLEELVR